MLLSFGAKNFFCFKEWMEISLAFNSKVPSEISKGLNAALTLCLKGGNASGKTNALKILSFLGYYCVSSFNIKPDDEIPITTFFNNESPSEFFVEFDINKIKYTYELILTKKAIISEKIYKRNRRNTLIFDRSKNTIKKNLISNQKQDIIVRSNASIISTARQYEIKEMAPFFNFFNRIGTNVSSIGTRVKYLDEFNKDSEFYENNKDYLEFTIKNLKKFDTGISGIEIKSYKKDNNDNIKTYYPVFIHDTQEKNNTLSYHAQSSGTKALFHLLVVYNMTLMTGGVLVLDEFDLTLHPDMLPHLIEMFENTETNPKKAQLIFSTHNCDIIDTMGKYRTYLFNREKGECYCYRLDELKDNLIRNDRPITPLYKSGKIGGIPKI